MRLCRRLRWRQPIPLTTIRQDYNWDYRLLTLNACIVLPDQSQGPFDNFIEMLARSTTLGAAVKKLSPATVAQPRRWARGNIGARKACFQKDSISSLPLCPYRIQNLKYEIGISTFYHSTTFLNIVDKDQRTVPYLIPTIVFKKRSVAHSSLNRPC